MNMMSHPQQVGGTVARLLHAYGVLPARTLALARGTWLSRQGAKTTAPTERKDHA